MIKIHKWLHKQTLKRLRIFTFITFMFVMFMSDRSDWPSTGLMILGTAVLGVLSLELEDKNYHQGYEDATKAYEEGWRRIYDA